MTEMIIELRRALAMIYSVEASNEKRMEANRMIETMREQSASQMMELAIELIEDSTLECRHFGWTLVSDVIGYGLVLCRRY